MFSFKMESPIVSDVKLLKKALKIGSFLGIFPRISTKHHVIWYVYSSLLAATFFTWSVGLIIYYQMTFANITNEDYILYYVDLCMLIAFTFIYVKTSLKRRKDLNKLLNNLFKLDRLLTTKFSATTSANRMIYYLIFLVSVLWAVVAFFSYSNIQTHYMFWYVSFLVFDTYNAVWIYCLCQICSVIRSSFASLEEFITKNFPGENSRTNIINLRTCEQSAAFKHVVRINVLIDDSVKISNKMFGGMVLMLFCQVFVNIINAFNDMLYMINRDQSFKEILNNFPYEFQSGILLAFAIIVIQACDDVQNAHVELVAACRKRLIHMEDEFLSKELFVLSAYMENLPPNFTAAGFFGITRRLLSSFSSTLISYLIVVLQFKMSSKKSDQGSY